MSRLFASCISTFFMEFSYITCCIKNNENSRSVIIYKLAKSYLLTKSRFECWIITTKKGVQIKCFLCELCCSWKVTQIKWENHLKAHKKLTEWKAKNCLFTVIFEKCHRIYIKKYETHMFKIISYMQYIYCYVMILYHLNIVLGSFMCTISFSKIKYNLA